MNETVKSTYNYDLFKYQSWNRQIDEANLKRIDREVKKVGWRKHPIFVDSKGYVYDGQHRLAYAKEHQLPIYYVVIDGLKKDDCQIMNTTRKKWTANDYIHFYAKQGNVNYQRIKSLCEQFDFVPASIIVSAIHAQAYGGHDQSALQNGNLLVTEKQYKDGIAKLNFYKKVNPYIKKIGGKTSQLFNAIGFCYDFDKVDNERLFDVIKKRIGSITPPANLEWALRGIEEIYNWHNKASYVYILTEYKQQVAEKIEKSRLFRKGEVR